MDGGPWSVLPRNVNGRLSCSHWALAGPGQKFVASPDIDKEKRGNPVVVTLSRNGPFKKAGEWGKIFTDHLCSTREGNVFAGVCHSVQVRKVGDQPPPPGQRHSPS